MNKIAILGAGGQIGRALVQILGGRGIALPREKADLSQPEQVIAALAEIKPDAVINAAAYTQVDKAESERDLAFLINGEAPAAITRWCEQQNIPFVHYSTDYVFDGTGDAPWQEDAATAPLNAYGESKLAGEQGVAGAGGQYLIFRTSWVYDAEGKNFLNTMLRFGAEREQMRVVGDQFGAPCYAPHLAEATLACLEQAVQQSTFPSGIYNLCNQGVTTWHGFASAIFAQGKEAGIPLKVESVESIAASEYPTPAKRPHNSRLDSSKLQLTFGITLPTWESGLEAAIKLKAASLVN